MDMLQQPPDLFVRITCNSNTQMLECEIMDQGIGIQNEDEIQRAFQFAVSSSHQKWDRLDEQQSYAMVRSPISSLGVGLTLSRMMMQKFGGNVYLKNRVQPTELDKTNVINVGCSAFLHLPLRDDIQEIL
jgi:pyruvate dehydrogenase kinase 2/3/4